MRRTFAVVSFVLFAIAGPMVIGSPLFAARSDFGNPWESNTRLVWNWRLPASTATHPNSIAYRDTLVAALRAPGAYNMQDSIWPNTSGFTAPMYVVDSSTPRRTVEVTDCYSATASTGRSVNASQTAALNANGGVRIPDGARTSPAADHELVVYDTSDDTLYEFWMMLEPYQTINDAQVGPNVQVNVSGNYQACTAGMMPNYSTSATGRFIDTPGYSSGLWGAAATGLSYTGGRITPLDLQRGEIRHAIDIALPWNLHADAATYPAWRKDQGICPISQCPAEGQRFRLPADVDLSGITNPFARMVAIALRDYGAIVNDTSGKISMRFDSSVGFTAMGEPDPWPGLFSQLGVDYSSSMYVNQSHVRAALSQIPFERLEFLPAAWAGQASTGTATTQPPAPAATSAPAAVATTPSTVAPAATAATTRAPSTAAPAASGTTSSATTIPSATSSPGSTAPSTATPATNSSSAVPVPGPAEPGSTAPTSSGGSSAGPAVVSTDPSTPVDPAVSTAISSSGSGSGLSSALVPSASSIGAVGIDPSVQGGGSADGVVSAAAAGDLAPTVASQQGSGAPRSLPASEIAGSSAGQIGGVAPVIAVNVTTPDGSTISELRLSPRNLCRAFTERDVVWNDPLIAADNPGVSLPDLPITPVVPEGGSVVARSLAEYCMRHAPEQWTTFMSELPDDERGDYADEWINGGSLRWPAADHMVTSAGGDDRSSLAVVARRPGSITFMAQAPAPTGRVAVARLTVTTNQGTGVEAPSAVSASLTARRSLATATRRIARPSMSPGSAVADLRPLLIAVYALVMLAGLSRGARLGLRTFRAR